MHGGLRFLVIEPKKINTTQRLYLAKQVFKEAHREVFKGMTFHEFYHVVFTPPTVQTKIKIYLRDNKIIGYSTFQLYVIKKIKFQCYIAMTELCLKESHSHYIHPIQFFINESAKFILLNPFTKIYMVDTLVSPVIYKKACQTTFEIYPVYNKVIPAKLVKLSRIVAKIFHWNYKSLGKIIIRSLNWKVKNKYFLQDSSKDPNKDYFSSIIPDFSLGKGLVIIIPITFINVIATSIKTLVRHFR
jgi:hypothetical protein